MPSIYERTVCVDFDGVIAAYDRWRGRGVFGEIIDGASKVLTKLKSEGWTIIIHTTRSELDQIWDYLNANRIPFDHINYNPDNVKQGCGLSKPLASVYLDDRAVCFDGNWDDAYNKIASFEPWYRRGNSKAED